MESELIDQKLKNIVPEDLLQLVLKLQALRIPMNNYVNELKESIEDGAESLKMERANDIINHINSAIVDLADLLSMEFAEKIIETNNI